MRRTACLALVALSLALAPWAAAAPPDPATLLPKDTGLYVGWSCPASSEAELWKMALQGLQGLAAKEDPDAAAMLGDVGKLIEQLQGVPVGIGLIDVVMLGDVPDIQLALVAAAGDKSAGLVDTVDGMLQRAGATIGTTTAGQVAFHSTPLPDSPFTLLWVAHEGRFIAALSPNAAEKVVASAAGQAPNLTAHPEFKFARDKFKCTLDGHFCMFADVTRFFARVKELAAQHGEPLPPVAEQLMEELGLNAIKSKYVHFDHQDGQPRWVMFAHVVGPRKGLLKIWDQPPLDEADVKLLPRDAYWASVSNLNLGSLYAETRRVIEAVDPNMLLPLDGAISSSAQMLGFSITDDLLPAFGDTWTFYDAPDHGGLFFSGTVLVAEAVKPDDLQGMLDRLLSMVRPMLAQEDFALKLLETRDGPHTIHYVVVGGAPVPVVPAWGFIDGRWVFGLSPQAVAVALNQVDPATRKSSVVDRPDYKAASAALQKNANGFGFCDMQYLQRQLYPLANGLGLAALSLGAKHGAELNLAVLPPVAASVAKATNYIGTAAIDDEGITYLAVGDTAPLQVAIASAALGASVALPSFARAREVAKETVSMTNLKQIGMAAMMYANDHDEHLPKSFDELIEGGLITAAVLQAPNDPDVGDASYVLVPFTQKLSQIRSPMTTVLAFERTAFGNADAALLFLDGHVERRPRAAAREAIQSAYEAAGIPDQVPEAWK